MKTKICLSLVACAFAGSSALAADLSVPFPKKLSCIHWQDGKVEEKSNEGQAFRGEQDGWSYGVAFTNQSGTGVQAWVYCTRHPSAPGGTCAYQAYFAQGDDTALANAQTASNFEGGQIALSLGRDSIDCALK